MNLSDTEIHVWHIAIDTKSDEIPLLEGYLSEEELNRANLFVNLDLKNKYILARGYLRVILSKYVEETPDKLSIAYSKHGKPFLKNNINNIEFNVTHCQSLCLLAITMNQKIGIDVERIGRVQDLHKVMKNCLSDAEQQELINFSEEEQEEAFLRGWTRKEAYTKAIGEGLLYGFSTFSVTLGESNPKIQEDVRNNRNLKNWTIMNVDVEKPYIAALSVNSKGMIVKTFKFPKG